MKIIFLIIAFLLLSSCTYRTAPMNMNGESREVPTWTIPLDYGDKPLESEHERRDKQRVEEASSF